MELLSELLEVHPFERCSAFWWYLHWFDTAYSWLSGNWPHSIQLIDQSGDKCHRTFCKTLPTSFHLWIYYFPRSFLCIGWWKHIRAGVSWMSCLGSCLLLFPTVSEVNLDNQVKGDWALKRSALDVNISAADITFPIYGHVTFYAATSFQTTNTERVGSNNSVSIKEGILIHSSLIWEF